MAGELITLHGVQVSLRRLLKLLGVKGRAGFDLSSACVPVIEVSRLIDLDSPLAPDAPYDSFIGGNAAVGGAGQTATSALFNPANSGRMLQVEQLTVTWFAANITLQFNQHAGDWDTDVAAPEGEWNKRSDAAGGVGLIRTNTVDAAAPARERVFAQAFGSNAVPVAHRFIGSKPMFIFPGKSFALRESAAVAGTRFIAYWEWSELPL